MEASRVKAVLDRGVRVDPGFPFPVEFIPTEVEGGIQIEAAITYRDVGTGEVRSRGIAPEFCSVTIPRGASDDVIKRGAHDALRTFLAHEASEVVMDENGRHVVEPHPES